MKIVSFLPGFIPVSMLGALKSWITHLCVMWKASLVAMNPQKIKTWLWRSPQPYRGLQPLSACCFLIKTSTFSIMAKRSLNFVTGFYHGRVIRRPNCPEYVPPDQKAHLSDCQKPTAPKTCCSENTHSLWSLLLECLNVLWCIDVYAS